MEFSNRAKRLIGQGMFQIKSKAETIERKGKKLLHFEIGDTCFNAPEIVKRACVKAIKRNKTHYVNPLGLFELRKKIADVECVYIENVAVIPANFGIFAALSILCNKGDKVDYPIPGFPTYKAVCNYLGLKKGKNPKVTIYNSPNNPTGTSYHKNVNSNWIIEDKIYDEMFYETEIISSLMFNKKPKGGYMIAPKEIIDKVGLLIETTYSCLPEFIQWAGLEALKIEKYKMKELRKRRDLMYNILKKHYKLKKPQGGIYCWCKCDDGEKEFQKLLKKGIVVCPGSVFGKKEFIRFCFARPIKEIKKLGERL